MVSIKVAFLLYIVLIITYLLALIDRDEKGIRPGWYCVLFAQAFWLFVYLAVGALR